MLKSPILAVALLSATLGLSAQSAPQQPPHSHQDAADAAHAVIPVPPQRWAPDAPLREGMRRVHTASAELQHYPTGNMSKAMALQRVETIKDAVSFMFANCKLEADHDQALHVMVLMPLLTAAQVLEADPSDMRQVQAMRDAVANYPRYFDDPGWPPTHNLAHSAQ